MKVIKRASIGRCANMLRGMRREGGGRTEVDEASSVSPRDENRGVQHICDGSTLMAHDVCGKCTVARRARRRWALDLAHVGEVTDGPTRPGSWTWREDDFLFPHRGWWMAPELTRLPALSRSSWPQMLPEL